MKESLLAFLACPDCAGALTLTTEHQDQAEIISGSLRCAECSATFPIRHGVPRFADLAHDIVQRATAANFGAQWLEFDHVAAHHEQQFRDWIAPVTPDFLRGKTVLEGGCGKGRHTRAVAEWGALAVIGVDLSDAVEAAWRNTRDLANAHIIQADIYRLPLKPSFDYAFSVGVLHHLPDPRAGFVSLRQYVRPGGAISAWVYGRENNGWIVHLVDPLRARITSRLSMRALYALSYLLTVALYAALKLIYRPLRGTRLGRRLFYRAYFGYISGFPFRELHNIVHDHLTAPVAFYLTRSEFEAWFQDAERVEINWHNQNSWRGFATLRGTASEASHAQRA